MPRTAVPAFLGLSAAGTLEAPRRLALPRQLAEHFGDPPADGYLAPAVEGFFSNGGELCFVVRLDESLEPVAALRRGLAAIADLDAVDLICIPDACRMRPPGEVASLPIKAERVQALQLEVIAHCEQVGTRVAILDSLPSAGESAPAHAQNVAVLSQRAALTSSDATLYHPWLLVHGADETTRRVPPCGHVAGVYARTDRATGVHKAPANEPLRDALDLDRELTGDLQGDLNRVGINCLRVFPGRGIRVWGARTLSLDAAWTYVNVRRLVLTLAREVAVLGEAYTFEPQGEPLWRRVRREVSALLIAMHRRGALRGAAPEDAFFVRCDAETNAGAEQGRLVIEIGLAAAAPNEFIVVHVVNEAGGVSVTGPNQ